MLIMLLDHVRETVFLHMQVGDPVDPVTTSPALFWMRFLSSFCAPTFVFLAGVSAYLYQQKHTRTETAKFLLKRGLILILLELIVIGTAWTGVFPPQKFFLQIIWCIGICMVALGGLIYLPRKGQLVVAFLLIAGHNLLDPIVLEKDHWFHTPWAILHQRDMISIFGIPARTSYPVLPWIGVILAGYLIGAWFTGTSEVRKKRFIISSGVLFLSFITLRAFNIYGDSPWVRYESLSQTMMGYFALTKYPVSLLFVLFTISVAMVALLCAEKWRDNLVVQKLAEFGSVAMFFYILHLYVLKVIYLALEKLFGTNKGVYYGVDHPYQFLLITIVIAVPLWYICLKFRQFKEARRDWKWLSYF